MRLAYVGYINKIEHTTMSVKDTTHLVHILLVFTRCWVSRIHNFWASFLLLLRVFRVLLFFLLLLSFLPVFLSNDPLRVDAVTINRKYLARDKCACDAYPSKPLTCHHLVPPTVRLTFSSPPRTLMSWVAASSQLDVGIETRTTRTQGGEGVRVLANDWHSSTVWLD